MNNGPQKPENNSPQGGFNLFNLMLFGLILTFIFNSFLSTLYTSRNVEIAYSQFIRLVESGNVSQVQITESKISMRLKEDCDWAVVSEILEADADSEEELLPPSEEATTAEDQGLKENSIYNTANINDPSLPALLLDYDVKFGGQLDEKNPIFEFMRSWVIPLVFIYFLFMLMRRMTSKMAEGSGSFMNMGKTSAKLYDVEKATGITFADVAGQEEAKESLDEIVDFLHHPEKYAAIGAKQPKGALLVGPPGTGKTLLAKAVAGEANVPYFSISGSEFVEMFVGVGASRVRDLFKQANKNAPCIIFIDEIDAIGKSRDSKMGGNDEREQTLNQLLAEMDGFDSSKGIIILAATNRPEILDKALLRPGRFDRRIIVEKPDLAGREAILAVHAKKVKLGEDVDLHRIALATSGASGADLANMINEAALRAVRMERESVLQEDIMESVEVVIAGKEKKDRILSEQEKKMVAYHEVGHALASAIQKNSQPVQKITIVPRTMGTLGYIMQMPEEERYLMTKEELLAQITTSLSGRAAEELVFHTSTTGASNDIEKATKMARSMVTQYGMSEKFDMMGLESVENQYLDGRNVATCSEATGAELDSEVLSIIKHCHEKAVDILKNYEEALHAITKHLIEKETILGEEFMEILALYQTPVLDI